MINIIADLDRQLGGKMPPDLRTLLSRLVIIYEDRDKEAREEFLKKYAQVFYNNWRRGLPYGVAPKPTRVVIWSLNGDRISWSGHNDVTVMSVKDLSIPTSHPFAGALAWLFGDIDGDW